MSQAAIIINVGDQEWTHNNGLAGGFLIPAKHPGEEFGLLVVYPVSEIIDLGDNKRKPQEIDAMPLARDICGLNSDGGPLSITNWGVKLCAAEPDVPRELEKAVKRETEYLIANPPEVKYRRKGNLLMAYTQDPPDVEKAKISNSKAVADERRAFELVCRTELVQKAEILDARKLMVTSFQRLVAQADMMWARPAEQRNISDLHRRACQALGQERPWCYVPQELVDCPGCGKKIQPNVIRCGHCNALFDREFAEYYKMTNAERAKCLYPELYQEREVETVGAEAGAPKSKAPRTNRR